MSDTNQHYQAVVLGAGVSGIYQIKCLADQGIDAVLLEADDDLGGTWYRNRYPGARFDSESYTYGYTFSRELLDEWHWKERFSSQPENLKYLNYVADKFGLRKLMRFNARVEAMTWHEDARHWHLALQDGKTCTARFVITGVGVLSIPTLPRIEGMDNFKGDAFHTYWWPKAPPPLAGRRVGIIGTGATAVQIIPEIAREAAQLTVFQRRPNWAIPLNNSAISEAEMAHIRARYDEIFANCALSQGGFEHLPDRRGFYNLSKAERRACWDKLYDQPGFALLLANFPETFLDEAANRELSEYVAERIRGRVKNPKVAEKLIPKDHSFGMQRLPLETHYFEAYNRDNVQLVDIAQTPIARITPQGIQTTASHFDLDQIIYATGFDAITGALDRMEIHGAHGKTLRDKWRNGPSTYIGLLTHGFPNMLMVAGPQSVSGSTNFPRAIEAGANWAMGLLSHVLDKGYTRFEAQAAAEMEWKEEVVRAQEIMPFRRSKSWFTGYNSNVAGHEAGKPRYQAYWGGAPKYQAFLDQSANEGYRRIKMS